MTATTMPGSSSATAGLLGRARWIHSASVDTAMAFLWVPFALLGVLVDGQHLPATIQAILLLSFIHQPITAALVYGDQAQFSLARRIFSLSPLIFIIAVLALRHYSFATLAVIAGLWNAEHTLMQRYGITRIYGRKVADDHGRVEKLMLFSWLALALLWTAADRATPGRIEAAGLRDHNREGIDVLTRFRTPALILVPIAATASLVLLARWIRAERSHAGNPAKWIYVASTGALFVTMFLNPIAGFMGYVGSHAVEYFVIVGRSVGPRYTPETVTAQPSPIGRVIAAPYGRVKFFVGYALAMGLLIWALASISSLAVHAAVIFTLGGMHVFYDGFIWKLRRPVVAQSLGI
ncbi:MAG TPA: hypothetical protein VM282_03585 [Acidimicrobiales bacterium]|nr:hypothetical protein [Acidimicrobiales bacterium]